VGVMLTYGAYMPRTTRVLRSAVIIAFSDGLASILAGLAIFPIVFQYDLSPAEGPGLLFMTLPIAFGEMAGGGVVGAFFFLLLVFAALTSSISLLESIVAHLSSTMKFSRARIAWVSGALLFLVGLLTVFSFNYLKYFTPLPFGPLRGKTIYEGIDYFGSNLLMPIGGILMAVIAGRLLPKQVAQEELLNPKAIHFAIWRFLIRFVAPVAVGMILATAGADL